MKRPAAVEVELVAGRDWIGLPLREQLDPYAWAARTVRDRAGGEPAADEVAPAAQVLADALRRAQLSRADLTFHALALQPDPLGPILATAEVLAVPFDPIEPFDLDEAEAILLDHDGVVGDPQITRPPIEVGPAVRVRLMFTEPDGTVLEGVGYLALPPELPGFVLLTSRWAALPIGDQLAERIDELAVRIAVHVTPAA